MNIGRWLDEILDSVPLTRHRGAVFPGPRARVRRRFSARTAPRPTLGSAFGLTPSPRMEE